MSSPEPDLVPFNAHAIPPAGSRGDNFDGKLDVRGADRLALERANRAKALRATTTSVTGTRAPVLGTARFAIYFVIAGILLQGFFGAYLRLGIVFVGCILACIALSLLLTKDKGMRGMIHAAIALLLGIPYLAIPGRAKIDTLISSGFSRVAGVVTGGNQNAYVSRPKTALELKRQTWAEEINDHVHEMTSHARLISCFVANCGADTVLVAGLYTGKLPMAGRAFYERVPMLDVSVECIRGNSLALAPGVLDEDLDPVSSVPKSFCDRFSPGGNWPYGAYSRSGYIVVWSPGPDGDMDYSPLKDFRTDAGDFRPALLAMSYDPTNGMLSSGDFIVVHKSQPEDCPEDTGLIR